MKLSTLKDSPQHYKDVLTLIEKNFHYQRPESFAVDFAPLMHNSNHAHNFILVDEVSNTLVAHIGVSLRLWKEHPVALLGGIAVSEEFQGQGIFKKLFEEIIKRYEKHVEAFVLWSDLHEMYKKYDFLPLKSMIQTGEKNFHKPEGYQETNFHKLHENEKKEITQLYLTMSKSYETLQRSEEDWKRIFAITSTKVFVSKNAQGHITRYFCLGKGMDLHDIIHEIGFSTTEEKLKLFQDLKHFKLWLPLDEKKHFPHAQELILALSKGTLPFFTSPKIYISGLDSI